MNNTFLDSALKIHSGNRLDSFDSVVVLGMLTGPIAREARAYWSIVFFLVADASLSSKFLLARFLLPITDNSGG